jgi:hypothetical protein
MCQLSLIKFLIKLEVHECNLTGIITGTGWFCGKKRLILSEIIFNDAN